MSAVVMVFARAPVAGEAKTRLIPVLGAEGAAALHGRLARHCLGVAAGAGVGPVALWCSPSRGHPFFGQCAREFGAVLHDQVGEDLGARMAHAFRETLKASERAIIIGTDCPGLTAADFRRAAAFLENGSDAVIGPAEDGGYVLLGLRRYAPELFTGITWSTDGVLQQTRDRLRALRWRWRELAEHWDVDRPEDVRRLVRENGWR